jgi:molecular chaperone HscB
MWLRRVISGVNLQSNDFELFGLPQQFAQDRAQLDARWKELQREAHPDKFSAQGSAAQRVAMQWSVRINEAYQRLKYPLKRAAYLCELGGEPVLAHSNTAMPKHFLMQQMEWREGLDDAIDLQTVKELQSEVRSSEAHLLQQCAVALDVQHDFKAALLAVRSLMFIEKFSHDLELRLEQLEDAANGI